MKGISAAPYNSGYIVVATTRDVSLPSGNQAITGFGFKPKAVIVFGNIGGGIVHSFGFGANIARCLYNTQTTWNYAVDTRLVNAFVAAPNDFAAGDLGSLDADGITIAWTKYNLPAGTMNLVILAFK